MWGAAVISSSPSAPALSSSWRASARAAQLGVVAAEKPGPSCLIVGPAWPAGRRQAGWDGWMDGEMGGWRRLTDLEGATELGGVGRDALHDGVKAVQLQTLVKHSRANLKYLL